MFFHPTPPGAPYIGSKSFAFSWKRVPTGHPNTRLSASKMVLLICAYLGYFFALPIKEPNNSSTLRLNTERLSGEEADNKMFAAAAFAHVQHKPIGPTHIKLLTTLQYLSHTEANTQSSERTLKTAG